MTRVLASVQNEEDVRKIISADFPELNIEEVRLITNGVDNFVAEIHSNFSNSIFRFPRHEESQRKLEFEIKILDLLKDKITTPFPRVEFLGKSAFYMGYHKIEGEPLNYKLIASLASEQKGKLAFDVAYFLYEIHRSISLDEAQAMQMLKEDLHEYIHLVKASSLPQKIKHPAVVRFMEETLKECQECSISEEDMVVLHNDLHAKNVAIHLEEKKLNGVFDFGDVKIGDIHRDFHLLYHLHPVFMKEVMEQYEKISKRRLSLKKVITHARMHALTDLILFMGDPESKPYRRALERIEQWDMELEIYSKKPIS